MQSSNRRNKPQSTTINIPTVGPVIFSLSLRAKRVSISIKTDQTVKVTIPHGIPINTAQKFLQSKIPWINKHLDRLKRLQHAYPLVDPPTEKAAKNYLKARLYYMATKYGFTYNKVFIRNQKTRWGSCSSQNNISLNISLVRLPEELQDYVILHELVHTKHKNHGPKFWAELNHLLGDAERLKKQMNRYRLADI